MIMTMLMMLSVDDDDGGDDDIDIYTGWTNGNDDLYFTLTTFKLFWSEAYKKKFHEYKKR